MNKNQNKLLLVVFLATNFIAILYESHTDCQTAITTKQQQRIIKNILLSCVFGSGKCSSFFFVMPWLIKMTRIIKRRKTKRMFLRANILQYLSSMMVKRSDKLHLININNQLLCLQSLSLAHTYSVSISLTPLLSVMGCHFQDL